MRGSRKTCIQENSYRTGIQFDQILLHDINGKTDDFCAVGIAIYRQQITSSVIESGDAVARVINHNVRSFLTNPIVQAAAIIALIAENRLHLTKAGISKIDHIARPKAQSGEDELLHRRSIIVGKFDAWKGPGIVAITDNYRDAILILAVVRNGESACCSGGAGDGFFFFFAGGRLVRH